MTLDPAQLRDFAEHYTAAWCSGNPRNVAAFFSPNGSLRVNTNAPAIGRTAIADVAQSFMTAFPDLVLTMDDIVSHGDGAAYHWTFAGTNTGPGGTGQRVHFSGFEDWSIGVDELIAESLGHFDQAEYEHQLAHGIGEPAQ